MNIVKNHCKKCGGFLNNHAGGREKEIYWFHPDHLGSSSYITGADGEVTQNIEYFSSGEVFVENHRNSNYSPYKFNGKELDAETGYYYYGARYYNPRVSLWLNVDPLADYNPFYNNEHYIDGEHNAGVYNAGNLNPYIYCYNSPVNYIDPNGKQVGVWEVPAAVYVVGFIAAAVTAYKVSEAAKKVDFSRHESPPVYQETIPAVSPKITREEIFRDKKESLRAEIYPAAKKDKLTIRTFPAEEKKKISFFSMFEPVGNKYINTEIKNVVNGQGTPRVEEDGSQKVFRGDGYARDSKKYGSQKNWVGSVEWDVPKSKNVHDRILERTNKDGTKSYGYSETANYEKIHEIKQK